MAILLQVLQGEFPACENIIENAAQGIFPIQFLRNLLKSEL